MSIVRITFLLIAMLAGCSKAPESSGPMQLGSPLTNEKYTPDSIHPKIVFPAVAAARQSTADAQRRFSEMQENARTGKAISFNPNADSLGMAEIPDSSASFRFWKIKDPDTFSTFMGDFAIHLAILGLKSDEYERLPKGYAIARYVLVFESECQFDSWLALENVGPKDMDLVRRYYREIGLNDEAEALLRAERAWYSAGGHSGKGYDAASEAYRTVSNQYSDEFVRRDYILNKLRPDSFWLAAPR